MTGSFKSRWKIEAQNDRRTVDEHDAKVRDLLIANDLLIERLPPFSLCFFCNRFSIGPERGWSKTKDDADLPLAENSIMSTVVRRHW